MKVGYQTFPSGKKYAFVREGDKRFFLRNIVFLRNPRNSTQIVVVREWGSPSEKKAWEPPKGQMEWKEFSEAGIKEGQDLRTTTLVKLMREGALREVMEEAKIMPEEIADLRFLPISYKQEFPKAGKDAFFRYQFWEGYVGNLRPAQMRLQQLVRNPDWIAMLPPDVLEKDGVAWWSPLNPATKHWIRGEFSGTMVDTYTPFLT